MRWVAVLCASVALALPLVQASGAQEGSPVVEAEKRVWVLGRDTSVVLTGRGFASCAGRSVQVGLFGPPGGMGQPVLDSREFTGAVPVTVDASGEFEARIALADSVALRGEFRALGVFGDCLPRPVFGEDLSFAFIESGAEAPVVLVVPETSLGARLSMGRTMRSEVGGLTVFADGQKCVSVDFGASEGTDIRVPVGSSGQPEACSKEGTTLTLIDRNGNTLFVKPIVVVGATQIIRNLAPEAAPGTGTSPDGGGQGEPAPRPANAGNSIAPEADAASPAGMERSAPVVALGAGILFAAGVIALGRLRGTPRRW